MTKRIYYEFFYYHSIPEMLLWGVLLLFFWTALALLFHRKGWSKAWIWINRILLTVVVLFILYWTVGKRDVGSKQELSLIPFYSFIAARIQPEMYREVVANILLFIPVGLSMPFSLPRRFSRHPIRSTILFSAILSLLIELLQYLFSLGLCETDDVIANTAGAAFGTICYLFLRSHQHNQSSPGVKDALDEKSGEGL